MKEQKIGFKQAINQAIRAGLDRGGWVQPFKTLTHHLGQPVVNLDRALKVAAELEDDELVRKQRMRK
jgi:hypothetical protein